MKDGVAAVVLAAGFGRRFGGGNKLHQLLDGRPLLAHALAPLARLGLTEVVVVHAPGDELALTLAASSGFHACANHARLQGMGSSLACGVSRLGPEVTAVLVVLGDMPRIPAAVPQALIGAFSGDMDEILIPTCNGQPGHPVLFGRAHFAALVALAGDEGARSVVAAHPLQVRRVEVGEPGILLDVDTPSGLQALS